MRNAAQAADKMLQFGGVLHMNMKLNKRTNSAIQRAAICLAVAGLISVSYVLSVLWRVSVAEHEVLGRDLMLKVIPGRAFDESPVPESRLSPTYTLDLDGIKIKVWGEKINGFQHAYGSALVAYELGDECSDKIFCLNEYMEWFFDKNGIALKDLLDRRRDLANNKVGRAIGVKARQEGLFGEEADRYIRRHVLAAMEFDNSIYTHPYDARVFSLPSETEFGCPFLPTQNLTNVRMSARKKFRRVKERMARRVHERLQWTTPTSNQSS